MHLNVNFSAFHNCFDRVCRGVDLMCRHFRSLSSAPPKCEMIRALRSIWFACNSFAWFTNASHVFFFFLIAIMHANSQRAMVGCDAVRQRKGQVWRRPTMWFSVAVACDAIKIARNWLKFIYLNSNDLDVPCRCQSKIVNHFRRGQNRFHIQNVTISTCICVQKVFESVVVQCFPHNIYEWQKFGLPNWMVCSTFYKQSHHTSSTGTAQRHFDIYCCPFGVPFDAFTHTHTDTGIRARWNAPHFPSKLIPFRWQKCIYKLNAVCTVSICLFI